MAHLVAQMAHLVAHMAHLVAHGALLVAHRALVVAHGALLTYQPSKHDSTAVAYGKMFLQDVAHTVEKGGGYGHGVTQQILGRPYHT